MIKKVKKPGQRTGLERVTSMDHGGEKAVREEIEDITVKYSWSIKMCPEEKE